MSSKKKVVVIGGGNGSSVLISALKNDFEVSAIVSMADDGGSTGRLRKELGTSAVGDIRQCLVAFTNSSESKKLFSYRFGEGELEGHSFGNLFLTTIEKSSGSLYKAIDQTKNILDITEGEVIPVTDDKPELTVEHRGNTVKGVYKIANTKIEGKKAVFTLNPAKAKISDKAKEAIKAADLITIAPGNFYCSIIPALIVKGMSEALEQAKAKKLLISNLVNFNNHTQGFSASDYLPEILRIANVSSIDVLLANNNFKIDAAGEVVRIGQHPKTVELKKGDLVSKVRNKSDPSDKIANLRSKIIHDKAKLNKIITQIARS